MTDLVMSETTGGGEPTSRLEQALGRPIRVNWELVAWIALVAVTMATRLWFLGDRAMSHDESLHTFYSWRLFQRRGLRARPHDARTLAVSPGRPGVLPIRGKRLHGTPADSVPGPGPGIVAAPGAPLPGHGGRLGRRRHPGAVADGHVLHPLYSPRHSRRILHRPDLRIALPFPRFPQGGLDRGCRRGRGRGHYLGRDGLHHGFLAGRLPDHGRSGRAHRAAGGRVAGGGLGYRWFGAAHLCHYGQ